MCVPGEQRDKIAEGSFTGVVRHGDRLYAVNCNTCTVHVYQHSNGWTESHSFSINATSHRLITLNISKDLLYACLYHDNRVDVFSLAGDLQFSSGSAGSGAAGLLKNPYMCCTDAAGAALIADYEQSPPPGAERAPAVEHRDAAAARADAMQRAVS